MLAEFEDYLLQNMRASDVVRDEEGILLFNVNQVAYLVEQCTTKEQQKTTKRWIRQYLPDMESKIGKCARSGKGL